MLTLEVFFKCYMKLYVVIVTQLVNGNYRSQESIVY